MDNKVRDCIFNAISHYSFTKEDIVILGEERIKKGTIYTLMIDNTNVYVKDPFKILVNDQMQVSFV